MLHRDIKPSNVLLARRDHVYLSDFGLARPAAADAALTRVGSIAARARYVAPEQVLDERVDARADIYALGCLLFEALTGEPPFAGAAGPLARLNAAPPSARERCPDLPPELDEVLGRALAPRPDDRYPSAGDLGQAALVAAGGQRRAAPFSVVATGEAGFAPGASHDGDGAGVDGAAPAPAAQRDPRLVLLRWGIAVAGLVVVAVAMVAAMRGIATL
jgi:serine/threonine-protein kinase